MMLEVEIDVFSGMPNPAFLLNEQEEQDFLDRVMGGSDGAPTVFDAKAIPRLGYRGLVVRETKKDAGPWSTETRPGGVLDRSARASGSDTIPGAFRLQHEEGTAETADWLLSIAERKRLAIHDEVWDAVRQDASTTRGPFEATDRPSEDDVGFAESNPQDTAPRGADWWACNSAVHLPNASLFNQPEYVTHNNCYCFGSNHLANVRFALPGRRGGQPAASITCEGVISGLRADGWIDGCQENTLTIALVIWPDNDYHFYRVVTPGADWWWGHKPGGTPAVYVDNSNRSLKQPLSPINCDRGPYIHFCGYFYQNNNTAFVA